MIKRKKLPKGWRWSHVSDLINDQLSGFGTSKRDPAGVIQFRPNNISVDGGIDTEKLLRVPCREMHLSTHCLEEGDVLFNNTNSRDLVGKSAIFEGYLEPVVFSNHITRLRTRRDRLDAYYLAFWLQYEWSNGTFKELCNRWVNQVGLSWEKLAQIKIPLPSTLREQERIVEVLRQADAIRRKRAEARRLADQILPALFLDMFGDPITNPKNWPVEPIGDLLAPEIERVNPQKAFPDEELTYLEIGNIDNQQHRIVEPKRILGQDAPSRARQVVRTGDVLYSMTRPNLRNIAVVPEEHDGAIATTGFAILRPKRPTDTAFIFEIVKSPVFTDAMARFAEAKSLYPAVDEPEIRRFPVMTPPSGHREQFAANYDFLSDQNANTHQAGPDAEHLFSVLLSRAFTGEFTTQGMTSFGDDAS